MKDPISVTVPMERGALAAAITLLTTLADSLRDTSPDKEDFVSELVSKDEVTVNNKPEGGAAVVAEPEPEVATTSVGTAAPAPGGVLLDNAGLPWDVRIHSGGTKKMKADGYWKKARGVADALVATVEAELRAAMAASPAAPVETAAPAPVETAAPAPVETAAAPAPVETAAAPAPAPEKLYDFNGAHFTEAQLKESGWNDTQIAELPLVAATPAPAATTTPVTFAELMTKITANGITAEATLAAANSQGLTAFPLLAARPDLIQGVHDELFPS